MTQPQANSVFHDHDVLVIGSGAAGLSLALRLAEDLRVAVLSKGPLTEGSTMYAQGGVSAVMSETDSVESHVHDTLEAGAGLCDPGVVRHAVENSRDAIEWLMHEGVPFSMEQTDKGVTGLHLTREGGHSHRRVVHAADATGQAIETTLVGAARAHRNLDLYERYIAVNLITTDRPGTRPNRCAGAYVLNRDSGHVEVFRARFVVLATGGASKVYLYTSNPDTATGDGIAMAWRAGCRVANMEFMQFHPTCLYHPEAKSFLITEAVRGEGGRLLLPNGERFMPRFDSRGELAPRDIVARAIDHEMKRLGISNVLLDISHKPADFILEHFPTVHARCLEFGFDMTQEPIPVVPAAHYTCGGVMTDLDGRTDIDGLYAIGETAFTGLHGANRMASNSLLECLVFAKGARDHIMAHRDRPAADIAIPPWDESRVTDSDEEVVVSHNWDELRRFMWDYVGIVRSTKRLQRAKSRVDLLLHEIHEYYSNFRVTNDLIELRNLVLVADLIIRSALARRESRGLHYTLDHPETDPALDGINTVLDPAAPPETAPPRAVAASD
ncbi:MAG: L-aspartate oxidase [Gammaproteobacteria bacterium]|nr:L-aspartate oxidase [Gammaproteobacteria bacterium]MDX5375680.1 L-aspartate oxidase [Gammaproteobacteria bacterium]